MAIMSSMATMLKNGAGNVAVCRIIAQPLSKALVQKYISNNGNIDDTLEAMGVVDGMDGIDFGLSTFAIDGKTVNVVAVYKIKPMGFSLIDYTYTVKQQAAREYGERTSQTQKLNKKRMKRRARAMTAHRQRKKNRSLFHLGTIQ